MTQYRFLSQPKEKETVDIIELYRQAGWWEREDDDGQVSAIVAGSHCFLVALEGERIIGMGRAISDRASDAYIQDVTVHPSRRGTGIGSELIRTLIDRLRADGIKWIGLIAEKDSSPFYRPFGFREMPSSTPMLMKYYG
ncbi:MAG: GNAT family N-acetyltransferase [Smithellaceae bacterium]|nr:GNAT family N-acetyltransferase [Smithellaceae bacterium]